MFYLISGGPLMLIYNRTWQVIGITSYGEGCARAHKPGSLAILIVLLHFTLFFFINQLFKVFIHV